MRDETRLQRLAILRSLACTLERDKWIDSASAVRWAVDEIDALESKLDAYRKAVRDLNDLLVEK